MLVEFSVSNWRSIKNKQTFSMVKSQGEELEESNTTDPEAKATGKLLNSAVIYGANASGKTNLISALATMKKIIVKSSSSQRGDKIPVTPFSFDRNKEPTEFEVIFVVNKVRYQYGFSVTSERVHDEWLFAFPNGRAQVWYQRAYDRDGNKYSWFFGKYFVGQKSVWQSATRENSLFLSTAIQLNSSQLSPVYDWFYDKLQCVGISGVTNSFTAEYSMKGSNKEKVINFLKNADLSIDDIAVKAEEFDVSYLPDDLPDEVKGKIAKDLEGHKAYDIKMTHTTSDGLMAEFDIDEESSGTQKVYSLSGPWFDTFESGCVLVIDELNTSLHPKVVKYLISLFHDKNVNRKNAQLVTTTHDTSILSNEVFRRDQIWFAQKDEHQVTEIYPMTDFSPRATENWEVGYRRGKYGAVPFISTKSLGES